MAKAMPLDEATPESAAPRKQWHTRRQADYGAGYSRWVRTLRVALPVLALGIVGVVLIWPSVQTEIQVQLPQQMPKVTMEHPRFTGTDSQNQPFVVTAERAHQVIGKMAVVDLEQLRAEIKLNDGTQLNGQAQIGRFDQDRKRLWLGGDVHMTDSKGSSFATHELNVDIPGRTAWTDRPARMAGDFGTVEGEGFRAYDGGKVVIFTGRSKAVLSGQPVSTTMGAP